MSYELYISLLMGFWVGLFTYHTLKLGVNLYKFLRRN